MAVLTLPVRHGFAQAYKDSLETEGCWFGLGQTSAWPSGDTNPPEPDPEATSINEPIGYKKASLITFVKQDPSGTITYLGEKYLAIEDEQAETENCVLLLIRAVIEYDELPATTTRQLGIFCGLTPSTGNESKEALLPAEVQDVGRLDVLDNTIPNTRAEYQRDEYTYMIQF